MKTKTKNFLRWIPSILVAFMLAGGAAFKFSGTEEMINHYSQLGLLPYVKLLGGAELLFVVLFLYPRTMKLGLLLLTAQLGGAMATELSHGNTFIPPMIILTFVWLAAYLRTSVMPGMKESDLQTPNYSI